MLPPADQGVLEANPDFASVYRTLTGTLLNTDASSRHVARDEKRATVREELKAHRIEVAKHQILKQAIIEMIPAQDKKLSETQTNTRTSTTTATRLGRQGRTTTKPAPPPSDTVSSQDNNSTLPPDLVSLLALLPSFMATAHNLPASSLASLLSNPPFTNLQQHFPQITSLLSTTLSKQASSLAKAVYPTTNPSFIHRQIPSLAITAETLTSTLFDSRRDLSQLRVAAAHQLTEGYLTEHLRAITFFVGLLEAKHTSAAASAPPPPASSSSLTTKKSSSRLAPDGSTTPTTRTDQEQQLQQPQVLTAHAAALEAQHYALASHALLSHAVDMIYPPDARTALATYQRHLSGARMRVTDASVVRVAELRDYGVVAVASAAAAADGDEDGGRRGRAGARDRTGSLGGGDEAKERTMREIARVYREMEGRMREVKRDLKRLGRI